MFQGTSQTNGDAIPIKAATQMQCIRFTGRPLTSMFIAQAMRHAVNLTEVNTNEKCTRGI